MAAPLPLDLSMAVVTDSHFVADDVANDLQLVGRPVDVDHGRLVGRGLNRIAIVMGLHELAPFGGRAPRTGRGVAPFANVAEREGRHGPPELVMASGFLRRDGLRPVVATLLVVNGGCWGKRERLQNAYS